MMKKRMNTHIVKILTLCLCAMMLSGCGKKEEREVLADAFGVMSEQLESAIDSVVEENKEVSSSESISESKDENASEEMELENESVEEEVVTEETVETEEATGETEETVESTEEEVESEEVEEESKEVVEESKAPEPTPVPEPTPAPSVEVVAPEPTPTPEPTPAPAPEPTPAPAPAPEPAPHTHSLYEEPYSYPTCTSPGWTQIKCSGCDYADGYTVPALGHTAEGYVFDEGDCVSPKITRYKCSVCGTDNVLPETQSVCENPEHEWYTAYAESLDMDTLEIVYTEVTQCSKCSIHKPK